MSEKDESYLVGWKLTEEGSIQTVYRWIKNPSITVTFANDGDGTTFYVMYNKSQIGYLAHSKEGMCKVIRTLLPMINNELNWFIAKFRDMLSELSDRISNNYALIDAIITSDYPCEDQSCDSHSLNS